MNIVKKYSKVELLHRAAAELFVEKACAAVSIRGRCNVVLAGGETPRSTYELLAQKPYCERLPWQKIHVYWGDERCVAATNIQSNQLMARQSFLNKVAIPAENIHPIVYDGSPEQAAALYENVLRATVGNPIAQLDFIFLGLGNDGHTASLFPATSVLAVQDHWVQAVYLEQQNLYRVTLTAPLLNQAVTIAFLITGGNKAQVVKDVFNGPLDSRLPAQLIQPIAGEVYILLDNEAGSLLDLP